MAEPAELSTDPSVLRGRLPATGVWMTAFTGRSAAAVREAAAAVERMGWRAWWGGEAPFNRDVFTGSALALEATSSLVVLTAVANIYARDPMAMKSGALTLGDAYPGRFGLGIGVSHASLVGHRGHAYGKPLQAMRAYLDAMAEAHYVPPPPAEPVPLLLAALRPRMLDLARERSAGSHTYFVGVAHTESAREALGPEPFLAPELMFVLDPDPDSARARVRRALTPYLENFPNYVDNLRRFGYGEGDFRDGGSDRLVDDLVAWGGAEEIGDRVRAHLDAGADHVCLQPLVGSLDRALAQLEELAPELTAISTSGGSSAVR
ncbi:MAG TPA: TIGR03620 family F420-dependent LLM class oxidoreductase [Solirubrobacterales bacterium]|nr:TIGR03620 family F420-dependent LLM class oxidoreductase [Solirubrobacterales bacterium]